MKYRLVLGWLGALLAMSAHAECVTVPDGAIVCGEGKAAMRVLSGTNSPNLRFALAWRERDGDGSGEPDPDNVDNLLVRLTDGAVLAKLGGSYWETEKFHANRRDEIAVWSKDSRFLVEISNGRWDTFSLRAVALDGDKMVASADLLPLIEKETRALRPRRKGSPPDDALSFRIDGDETPILGKDGELRFRALLFVPKSDDGETAVDFRVRLSVKAGKLQPRVEQARRVRG